MSKRITLTVEAVGKEHYDKLQIVRMTKTHPYVVELFQNLKSRRKSYMLTEFNVFKPHATEYIFKDFFQTISMLGRVHTIPKEEPEHIKFVKTLVSLSNRLGHSCDYEDMMDKLETVCGTKVKDQIFIELIPNMIYAYTAATRSKDLVLKLEYFFGAEVIDILLVHEIAANTGKERQSLARARIHATRSLAGLPINARKTEKN